MKKISVEVHFSNCYSYLVIYADFFKCIPACYCRIYRNHVMYSKLDKFKNACDNCKCRYLN